MRLVVIYTMQSSAFSATPASKTEPMKMSGSTTRERMRRTKYLYSAAKDSFECQSCVEDRYVIAFNVSLTLHDGQSPSGAKRNDAPLPPPDACG